VRHTSPIWNSIFSRIVPWLEPTRYDKTLKKFANYDELWVPAARDTRPWASAVFKALIDAKQSIRSAIAGRHDSVASTVNELPEPFHSIWIAKLGVSLVALAMTTAALLAVDTFFDVNHLSFVFLLPVFIIAIKFGKMQGAIASAASCLIAAFYFYTPKFSIFLDDPTNLAELACFGAIALMISKFAGKRASETLVK
jgi:K+-sensing histidine kinase KdpD